MSKIDDGRLGLLEELADKFYGDKHDLFFLDKTIIIDFLGVKGLLNSEGNKSLFNSASGRIFEGASLLKELLDEYHNTLVIKGVIDELNFGFGIIRRNASPSASRMIDSLTRALKDSSLRADYLLEGFSGLHDSASVLRDKTKMNKSEDYRHISRVNSQLLVSAFWCAYNHPENHVNASVVSRDYDIVRGYLAFNHNHKLFSSRFPKDFPYIKPPERGDVRIIYSNSAKFQNKSFRKKRL